MVNKQTSEFTSQKLVVSLILGIIAPGVGHIYAGHIRRGLIIILTTSAITVIAAYFLAYPLPDIVESIPFTLGQIYQLLLVILPIRVWQTYDFFKVTKKMNDNRTMNLPKPLGYLTAAIIATYIIYLIFPVCSYVIFGYANPFFRLSGESMLPTISEHSTIVSRNELAGATFDSLRVGDVISFLSPDDNDILMHRVVHIKNDQAGNKILMTTGDGNAAPVMGMDYPIREENYIDKAVFIFDDPFEVYRLEDIPIYLIIAPVLTFIYGLKIRKQNTEN